MNKIKIILVCLFIPLIVLTGLAFLKIKHKEEYQKKVILAQETRKALEHLMVDLREARENTIQDVPADGMWHHRIFFDSTQQGALEYVLQGGHLMRINNGHTMLIADNIADLRIRRQKQAPDILEVQIEAHKNVSLVSNLRIRIRH